MMLMRAKALKRPMAVATRVGLFSRQVIEKLSLAAIDMLLERVSTLSEGQILSDDRYFGSTMLTLDVRELDGMVRDTCDVATAIRLARLLGQADGAADRIRALAHEEATRIAGQPLRPAGIDVRVRAEAHWIFIDVDVEGRLEVAREAQR